MRILQWCLCVLSWFTLRLAYLTLKLLLIWLLSPKQNTCFVNGGELPPCNELRSLWYKKSQPYNRPTDLGQAWVLRAGAFVLESGQATDQCWLILAAKKYWPRCSQRPKGRPACISAQLTQSGLLHEELNTLVVECNNQAIGGIKLMAKWWRNKSNLVHQPCCSAWASVTGCQALGPGLANLCACGGLP